jgi:4-hydroxybenzoate polyprenyltransferase
MILQKIRQTAELIKFSHSIFALPFALASMLIAANGLPPARLIALIVLAMVTLRNAGMSFNRVADALFDAKNPRTATRHIPQGILSRRYVVLFSLINALLFVLIVSQINRTCFWLSFPALGLVYLYSYTKRFTDWSHLVLGLVLGVSPSAAWVAVRNALSWEPVILGLAVTLWVAGFDIIYATQDHQFDSKTGLHSLVVRFGVAKALRLSQFFHALTLVLLFLFGRMLHFGGAYYLTLSIIAFLFFYEHSLVSPRDLSRVNAAFFNVNGFISLLFLAGVTLSL